MRSYMPVSYTHLDVYKRQGLFVAYDNVEFLAPVYAGDYIEAVGEIVKVGNTSRKMVFEARKVVAGYGRLLLSQIIDSFARDYHKRWI